MERVKVPYKMRSQVATFAGEWTAEQIDAGLAGEPTIEVSEAWFEPTANGPVQITDEGRIAELEAKLATKQDSE